MGKDNKQRQLHLGAFIFGVGHHVATWRYPETKTSGLLKLNFYRQFAVGAINKKLDTSQVLESKFVDQALKK
ncbi:alkanesulfonate monooxygenase [Paenibacillus sp. yr247]|uniref:hypothetical protein n=1 Tax=Paenibacillus sp. yr247 TaxID=1761880 RepID=UPI000889D353|nr:hypothetical protein [Paenibacillus sp. yr247]SDN23860.1 alkanesulfonate monooxygenase [Paenibacillus sp. yr247]